MTKNTIFLMLPDKDAQKNFLDGKMIFLKIISGVSIKNFLYPSVYAKIYKNFEQQEVV